METLEGSAELCFSSGSCREKDVTGVQGQKRVCDFKISNRSNFDLRPTYPQVRFYICLLVLDVVFFAHITHVFKLDS